MVAWCVTRIGCSAQLIGVQSHLVVASGASNSNSLRVVRSGVGLEEVVNVEGMNDVTGMWTLTTTG